MNAVEIMNSYIPSLSENGFDPRITESQLKLYDQELKAAISSLHKCRHKPY